LAQAVTENPAAVDGELLEHALVLTPREFERLVVRLLERMGYGRSGGVEHSPCASIKNADEALDGRTLHRLIGRLPLGLQVDAIETERVLADGAVDTRVATAPRAMAEPYRPGLSPPWCSAASNICPRMRVRRRSST
jgi:restriction endonuclease Mrr